MRHLSLLMIWALVATPGRAEIFNGVNFPAGAESFADLVLRFDPQYSGGEAEVIYHPHLCVGAPDLRIQSLGDGGLIELEFVDNFLTNSHGSSPDLYIGEADGTPEDYYVSLRPTEETRALLDPGDDSNGDGYFELGRFIGSYRPGAYGHVRTIDIDQYFPSQRQNNLYFDAIQIVDDPERGQQTGVGVGFELDAVGAITSSPSGMILQHGDTDDDGDVDLVDLNNVRNQFGGRGLGDTWPFDGEVNLADLNEVRNNFGALPPQAVPEPTSIQLILLSLAMFSASLPGRRGLKSIRRRWRSH